MQKMCGVLDKKKCRNYEKKTPKNLHNTLTFSTLKVQLTTKEERNLYKLSLVEMNTKSNGTANGTAKNLAETGKETSPQKPELSLTVVEKSGLKSEPQEAKPEASNFPPLQDRLHKRRGSGGMATNGQLHHHYKHRKV